MQITASLVNELRQKTGVGMMQCKKALTETDGDIAPTRLPRKAVSTSWKLLTRLLLSNSLAKPNRFPTTKTSWLSLTSPSRLWKRRLSLPSMISRTLSSMASRSTTVSRTSS